MSENKRPEKGKSLLSLPDDYVVIDIETTGLIPYFDSIIEISAIRYSQNVEVDRFSTLINPHCPLPPFIVELTGITDDMLVDAPSIDEVFSGFLDFIGDSILVGHNVNFDINFLYDVSLALEHPPISNDFIDTLRLARWCHFPVEDNRLVTLVDYFNISTKSEHRAVSDCIATYRLYLCLKQYITENQISFTPKKVYHKQPSLSEIVPTVDEISPDNPFFDCHVVFTGKLELLVRKEAAQYVVNLGALAEDHVTKRTNILILGDFDYCHLSGEKSRKLREAERRILAGQDLQIIPESVFVDMLSDYFTLPETE